MLHHCIRFPEGKSKAVTFSYDDGCIQDIRFSDLLTKYHLKGTFNLNSDALRGDTGMSYDDIKTHILENGHEIAIHGYYHKAQGTVRAIEGIKDVLNCRLELEKKYGRIIRGMAYPDWGISVFSNGASYDTIKHYLTDLDIAYARSLGGDNNKFELPQDWHNWMPTAHHNNPKIFDYIDEFLNLDVYTNTRGIYRNSRLFYIWGHSYEFDRENNWEHIEKICDKFSKCDDIWFATNIEIYDYVNAYHSLIYSVDGTLIFNPTLFTIWIDIDGELHTISPGETLKCKEV